MEHEKFGNVPLLNASACDSLLDSSWMNDIIFSANSIASSELYGMPSFISISAKPMTPRPILRLAFVIVSICGSGNLFMSMTLSRKWMASFVVRRSFSQSSWGTAESVLTIFVRFIEPRLQLSYGRRGCSPHGFVDSIAPIFGVGFDLLILSMNIMPGSPFFHALFTIMSNTSRALRCPKTFLLCGAMRSYSSSRSTLFMNSSVIATEMLKFVMSLSVSLHFMKSSMSGWSTRSMPMFAPRRVPPCFTACVAASNTFMKDTGPLAMPPVVFTIELAGRSLEKENPVPPPERCMSAVFFIASNIDSIESSTGRTKHADSCCSSRPAFIKVGEFGRKSRLYIIE